MDSFYIEKILESLDERKDITDIEIVRREFQFFRLLEHGSRKLRIYQVMAKDPGLFHELLRHVYIADGEEKSEADPQTTANARQSYHIVSSFNLLPGQEENDVNEAVLSAWIDEFRHIGVQTNRPEITDTYVGRILAHSPSDPDGAWPHRAVRDQLERLASDAIERGLQIERFNMRGPHWRGVYDGGAQERDLAKTAFDAAEAMVAWPRTSAILRAIGRSWEEQGKRADLEAAQRRMRS
jgi:hypothetical protein